MLTKNSNVILTGATSGIGLRLAHQLSELGVNLAICGRNTDEMKKLLSSSSLVKQIKHSDCFCITNETKICQFVNESLKKLGSIDILINCAGANTARSSISELCTEDLDYNYNVNCRAPFIFMREAFASMKTVNCGTILNVQSTVCLYSNEGIGAYTAAKSAFDALTKVFRKEASNEGVHILNIYPGGVDTNFREAERPEYMNAGDVATAIIAQLSLPSNVIPHELVIRPVIEKNY